MRHSFVHPKIGEVANGTNSHRPLARVCAREPMWGGSFFGLFLALIWLASSADQLQATNFALGTTALLEGPKAGSNVVALSASPSDGTWTAAANATWLHLDPAAASGLGGTNVFFGYDANSGSTRTGTLTIAGLTLTVTQAGAGYVPAEVPLITLVDTNLSYPYGIAADAAGDIYIADTGDNALKEWIATSGTLVTLVSNGLNSPLAVAVDGGGDVYIADNGDNAIKKWTATNGVLSTVVALGSKSPLGVAVSPQGNVFITVGGQAAVYEWVAASNKLTTLVSNGLSYPSGLAVDASGNVFIADIFENAIEEWNAAEKTLSPVISEGLNGPDGVALDGLGNIYVCDNFDSGIWEWVASSKTLTNLVQPYNQLTPADLAVDASGNVYIANFDTATFEIYEQPYAFMDLTPRHYNCAASSEVLPPVLISTSDQLSLTNAISDQSWLILTGMTNNALSFELTTNGGPDRACSITFLNQASAVDQYSAPYVLNTPPLARGEFKFAFSNFQSSTFTVLASEDLQLPLTNWSVIGTASNISPNLYQFTDPTPATNGYRYYRVRSQ